MAKRINVPASPLNLKSIGVSGYKSLYDEFRLEIRPITILAGANSSGKSSMMQPLLLLKQTLEANYDPGPLRIDGPNVRFTSSGQMFSRCGSRDSESRMCFELELGNESELGLTFQRNEGSGIRIIEQVVKDRGGRKTTLRPTMRSDTIAQNNPEYVDFAKHMKKVIFAGTRTSKPRFKVQRQRCFLEPAAVFTMSKGGEVNLPLRHFARREPFEHAVSSLIHVPGLRGEPSRSYGAIAARGPFPGTFHPYAASLIDHWKKESSSNLKLLTDALKSVGLTWKVEARHIEETAFELAVGRLRRSAPGGARDLVSIADVGFGVSQVLPVLVAAIAAKRGQVVYLEQPELHLHPNAQWKLGRFLCERARHGARIVIETHSRIMLLAIQQMVAEGLLDAADTSLNWFSRDPDGCTVHEEGDMDEFGTYGDWPADFDDAVLKAEHDFLEAVSRRQNTKRRKKGQK